MKIKLMTLLLALVTSTFAMAITDVPDAVKTAFKEKFPKAKDVEWDMEEDGTYEAEFELKGKEYEAAFNKDGTWIYTAKEMDIKDFPVKLKEAIQFVYQSYTIEEVKRVTHSVHGECYEIELKNKAGEEIDLLMSDTGQELNRKVEKKSDDEEDEDDNEEKDEHDDHEGHDHTH